MHWFLYSFGKYANFDGRARRTEYWMFSLFNLIFLSVAIMLDNLIGWTATNIGFGPFYGIYILAVAIPSISVSVRRLHDSGTSGWLVLLGLVPVAGQIWFLYKMLVGGDAGSNAFGADPKESTTGDLVSRDYTDAALVFTIVWMILANLFYRVVPTINPEYYAQTWFLKTSIVLNFIWSLLPILIAIAIRKKKLQIVLFGAGAIYLVYGWVQLIMDSAEPIL